MNKADAAAARTRHSRSDPLARWQHDHDNFAKLLDLVEEQVDAFHAGREPDYELLHTIVHYLRHYPDRFHHPREDLAFARLAQRDPAQQLAVARRQQEHAVIANAGQELLDCLDQIIAGVVIERTALEAAAATYLVYYRHHITAEEDDVIPRAVALFVAEDWAAIAAVPTEPDPLFGSDFDARYQELRQLLTRMAETPD